MYLQWLEDLAWFFRYTSLFVCAALFISVASRWRVWFGNPPLHIRLFGLASIMVPITVTSNAIYGAVNGVSPTPVSVGSVIILLILTFAILLMPEADGRTPSPITRWIERMAVKNKSD